MPLLTCQTAGAGGAAWNKQDWEKQQCWSCACWCPPHWGGFRRQQQWLQFNTKPQATFNSIPLGMAKGEWQRQTVVKTFHLFSGESRTLLVLRGGVRTAHLAPSGADLLFLEQKEEKHSLGREGMEIS